MAAHKTEEKFNAVVRAYRKKLPITIQATEGFYNSEHEISNGDIMRVLAVDDRVFVEFNHPDTGEKVKVKIPLHYTGGFETVLRHGPNHVYRTVAEIARDFPQSVRVLEDVEIQGMVVKRGEGLKLEHVQKTTEGNCLHCTHVQTKVSLLVPYSTRGRFSPRRDDGIYTIEELENRMPVLVKRESNVGRRIRDVNSHVIPGVPDDFFGTMLLTNKTMVTIDHWDDPGSLGIYDINTKRKMQLPIDFDITVIHADGIVAPYGSSEDLFAIARECIPQRHPVFAVLSSGQKGLDYLNLARDVVLMIHRIETKKGFLINGRSSRFLVPNDYKNTTRFKILGNEYITPYDLWKSKFMGPVKAAVSCKAPEGFPEARSIYKNDEVRLSSKPTQREELPKLVGSDGDSEEMDVVHLERILSTTSTTLGSIYVPSYLTVHLREAPPSLGEHTLGDVTKYGKLPMRVELSTITRGASMTKDDNNLLNEGPLTIETECEYSVAYVTLFDPHCVSNDIQEAREIPHFLRIQVRPIREKFPVKGDIVYFKKPTPQVFYLTLKQYSELYESTEEDVEEDKHDYDCIPEKGLHRGQDPPLPPRSPALETKHGPRFPPDLSHHGNKTPLKILHRSRSNVEPHHLSRSHAEVQVPLRDPVLPSVAEKTNKPSVLPKSRPVILSERSADGTTRRKSKPMVPIPTKKPIQPDQQQGPQAENKDRQYIHLRPVSELTASGLGEAFDLSSQIRSRLKSLTPHSDKTSTIPKISHSSHSGYEEPTTNTASPDQELIPKHPPPSDGNISEFDTLQLAGMLRHLDFGIDTVRKCIQKQVDGAKLCEMTDEQLKQKLGVTNDSRFYAIKHFVSKSKIAADVRNVRKVPPPKDGKILNFDVQQIAGLLKHFEFTDQAVSNCLMEKVDGKRLCDMASKMSDDDDALKKELKIDTAPAHQFFALKYCISVSMVEINNN
ncbi:uncharacterized protein [Amphiura filiformis]|uniref:uncharacterized protein n=1 Tax=Amphiura filiformis TaxID=82378 RepID=UPI003B227F11